jgi:uncharacterized protein (TIGR04376 family)
VGLFDDLNRFLESRLEEFLRNNPHLELQALEEQLRQQEKDTLRLIIDLQAQEKRSQDEILSTAQEIQLWHSRVAKAKASGRDDLAQAAQEREAALLREGNQVWGKMQGIKQQIDKSKELQRQIQVRHQEIQTKLREAQATRSTKSQAQPNWETTGWNQSSSHTPRGGADPLDEKFRRWEMDEELEQMKRNIGR